MESALTELSVSLAEFRDNPDSILREANKRPVVVVDNDGPAFYLIDPQLFQAIMDEIADRDLQRTVLSRLADKSRLVEVSLDEL